MKENTKMLRTWLFVPGHEPYKMRKALASGADVVIIDWEDAVPHDQKSEARMQTQEVLAQTITVCRVAIRINSLKSSWYADEILALKALNVAVVMVPKTEDPAMITTLAEEINLPIVPLIESALGMEQAFAIAKAHPLVERLAFGSLDFFVDIGARWTPEGEALLYARSRLVIAGRAAGLAGMIDGVYPQLGDLAGLRTESVLAYTLGCEGKLLLHPRQIEVVREVFQPTREELERARLIIRVAQEAAAEQRAVIQFEGIFIDPPLVLWAQQVLKSVGES
jgi:citrate lyase subunit beta/citryl-CoA lyase